ncbi:MULTISPECIES: carbohydrate ABC transporter permease [unclassified Meiothermus]|uniref:carbohydrate ABC transporter permease n=1 Tax=unclassified Meiothermus TaxID=370471 RepID=UPI000D7C4858|nr:MULTISPECIES: carbohydrate ABC transporter permease [unclassified Meiothermus]PZA07863.1 carbohydrate ABC transporter permease [Meiothermus sp. Pnk-1]RYM38832.1 carbohydrate ABC transporter permease [Meiothermus sp. PNK-Is4]
MSAATATQPHTRTRKLRRGPNPWVLAVVWFFALLWLVPFVGAIITSFRTFDDLNTRGFWSVPQEITVNNYVRAWGQAGVSKYLLNSFKITLPALAICVLFASMCAYGLVRFRFRLAMPIYVMFVAGLMLPFQVLLLPVFFLANKLHLYDTLWALILFHAAFQLGFCTFVLRNFMKTIPFSLFESALIDGASEWTIFRRIALPLLLPGLAALATLEFTWIFNDYLWAIVLLQSDEFKPITTGLANLRGQYVSDWPLMVAGSLIATVPTLVVFFGLQRYFIDGLTVGATKG